MKKKIKNYIIINNYHIYFKEIKKMGKSNFYRRQNKLEKN